MRKDYKVGDIVELLNYYEPTEQFMKDMFIHGRFIPLIGHRYHVNGVYPEKGVCVQTDFRDEPFSGVVIRFDQVMLYKRGEDIPK